MSVVELLISAMEDIGEKQKAAESIIYKARDDNLALFLQELVRIAREETTDIRARQMALLLLKNTVAFNAREEQGKKELEDRWKSISPEIRCTVRQEVLATLGSTSREVRNIAAIVVANLARIEVPRNEWPDLLPALFTAAKQEATMEAAIMTLGYICEETNTCTPLENVLLHCSNDILSCVINGMRHVDNIEVIYQSTNALCNSITFIHNNMEAKEERDFIMSTICSNCVNKEARTVTRAMECLCRVAAEYYGKLLDYMQAIFTITIDAISSNAEEAVMQGFQFWTTICEVELELLELEEEYKETEQPLPEDAIRYQRYALGAAARILPATLSCLLKQDEFQTEDDWNISTAAGVCLQRFATVLRDSIGEFVMPFVQEHAGQTHWRNCEAGIMAFACVLEGPSTEVLQSVISSSLKMLFVYSAKNQHPLVRDTSVWAISRIANFHPQAILSNAAVLNEVMCIAELLMDDTPILANKACSIIHNLCLEVEDTCDDWDKTNCMSCYFKRFVISLMKTVDRPDAHESNLRAAAQETLNSLLSCAASDVLADVSSLIPEFVARITKSFTFIGPQSSTSQIEEVQLMQGLLCGALQHIVQKLSDSVTPEQATSMMGAFSLVLQHSRNVQEEALMAIGALAAALGENFLNFLEPMSNYFYAGLRTTNDAKILNVTVGVLGDIFAALGPETPEPFTDQVMTILLENIRNDEIYRDCRPPILSVFGDIALHIGKKFQKYLAVVMNVFASANTVASQVDPDDEELVTFSVDLLEAICDGFTGLLQGMKHTPELLLPAMDAILQFIMQNGTADKVEEKVLECCVSVSGDVLNVFGSNPDVRKQYPQLENFVRDGAVQKMVQRAQQSRNKDIRKAADWAIKQAQLFFA